MDGGVSRPPFMRPQGNQKRSYSTMAASHRDESSPLRDEHYENEHAARRRRFEAELRPARRRYPGDGLDFRRPVASSSPAPVNRVGQNDDGVVNDRTVQAAVIDLTDDGALEELESTNVANAAASSHPPSARERSRRPARSFANITDVIDIESSGDEEEGDGHAMANLPGANFLALPNQRTPPAAQVSTRRTLMYVRPTPPNMDEVQVVDQRPLRTQRQATTSQPGSPRPRRRNLPPPVEPPLGETIDLTEDDDEVVHLDTRQRGGVNLATPEPVAGAGYHGMAGRGLQHMGQIATMMRERGADFGGRLYQRIQDLAGPGVLEEFERQNHAVDEAQRARMAARRLPPPVPNIHHEPFRHHANHHRPHRHPYHPHVAGPGFLRAAAQALGVQNDMANMMNYAMTAFDMGTGRQNNHRPPTPKYEPPAPAAPGFTHSPAEDDVVVCPNCGDELAMGEEGIKREIWVVKTCGHAYCGECAYNRNRGSPRKGGKKGKAPVLDNPHLPPPFKTCVVPGCGRPTTRQSMIHVYLGT